MIYFPLAGMLARSKVTPSILLACPNSLPVLIQKAMCCSVPFLRPLPPKTNVLWPAYNYTGEPRF